MALAFYFVSFIGVIILSQFFVLAHGQGTCQPWQGQPALCAEIFTPNVTHVWTVLPQQALASLMQNYTYALLPLKSLAKGCYLRSLYLLCTGYMPPVCQETNLYCSGVTPTQDCAQLNPFRASPAFPNGTFDATYNNVTYTLPCGTPSSAYLNQNYSVVCEGPLRPSPAKDGTCALRCPQKFFTDKEWSALMITQQVLGWIGFVLVLLMTPPFLIIRDRRKAPIVVQTWLIASVLPLAIGLLLPSFSSGDIICTSDTRLATRKNFACVLQAILLHFASVAGQIWCFWLMFDSLIFILTKSAQYIQGKWFWAKCLFTNGLTVGLIIATLASNAYESSANYTFCFLKGSNSKSLFTGHDSFLLWMPLAMFWVLSVISWSLLSFFLVRMVGYKSSGILLAVRSQIRLLLFVLYFFLAVGMLLLYRITQKRRYGEFSTAFTNHILCWAAKGAGAQTSCSAVPHPRSPYGFDFAALLLTYGIPIFFTLCLGMVEDVKQFYIKLWRMIRTGSFGVDELRDLTERSTATGSGGSSKPEQSFDSTKGGSQMDSTY